MNRNFLILMLLVAVWLNGQQCENDSIGLTPINETKSGSFFGMSGAWWICN